MEKIELRAGREIRSHVKLPERMHSCQVCDKTYQTRGSLTRHLRNHSVNDSQHVCPTCGVAFSRRDLLRRHVRIHRLAQNNLNTTTTSNDLATPAPRRRCHTACQPCREARVKCDGGNPCSQCIATQTECLLGSRTGRVSRVVEKERRQEQYSHSDDGGSAGEDDKEDGDQEQDFSRVRVETSITAAPAMLHSPVSNVDAPIIPFLGSEDPLPDMDNIDHLAEMDFSWTDSLPCTTTSWPWLHESLLLQGNPLLNWTNDSIYALDTGDMVPDSCPGIIPLDTAQQLPVISPTKTVTSMSARDDAESGSAPPSEPGKPETRLQGPDMPEFQGQAALQQDQIVEELVAYAEKRIVTPGSKLSRSLFWQSMSIRIAEAFRIDPCDSPGSESTLNRLMQIYKENFSPLWPLLSGKEFDSSELHPLLFLTVVSIGCMYGTSQECNFGNKLHERVRRCLAASLIGLEDAEGDILWLGRARLLTQVAALYFGQRRAFSYAQHVGAITLAQARRMDLFSTVGRPGMTGELSLEQQTVLWQNAEARKRLAFGILRADVFTSVLLNTRPLLSAEEIYLDLPASDEIWMNLDTIPLEQLASRLKDESSRALGLPFCDLVRVASDRGEALLNMNPRGYELLIFGLQEYVWRFSHDRSMFPRLIGQSDHTVAQKENLPSSPNGLSISASLQTDQLGRTYRRMNDLRNDRCRITQTLQRWEQSFTSTRTTQSFGQDRTSVMSSLLLLYISYLRLCVPLADLHSAAYILMDNKPLEPKKLQTLQEWAKGTGAVEAIKHVCQIWSLLSQERFRTGTDKAKYNLLSFSGLHHAAVVIWTFAGVHSEPVAEVAELPGWRDMAPISIQRDQTRSLLRAVVSLYKHLIPRGWYSFAAVAESLAAQPFPDSSR
ncbi:hypothetical protein AN9025.2 [Aspergillus nidulans FGSC A4]|uniref:Transcription factor with C2H2 and Zn(2)-Cys(6) DNA binding domain (Eurofung) n=1 Tax=Emericella nidulans (strain FGSC A4 / ATCC 38163 / CBS 112.46 / NRRL 194 / M139) TaxID=227321 RepID=Q5ARQ5_EMENI|nr:hypothetical protein [Aspergillus nidulans FGSC A4]EAA64357.1 hypothetical protein AN9025.2 [Aspergillus nidulans FGSC A4]CBF84438.1 TPA: Putative transcription factor with C2H2 and Zn(2)-Cys(6) DNA binding domain (Eurofung) [Aspergillus nidulans FGSC A4]|eukprot:XP_682294.1 hypothetical protein AN9025.2 [Aspergillus nidulans FGSC A4]